MKVEALGTPYDDASSATYRRHSRLRTQDALPPVLSVTASALLLSAAAMGAQHGADPTPWQVLPAGISAVVAAIAVVMSGFVYRSNRVDRVEEQARQVYAWQTKRRTADGRWEIVAVVHNQSESPIWRVELLPRRGGAVSMDEVEQHYPDLQPKSSAHWAWTVPSKPEADSYDRTPRIGFFDAASNRWEKVGSRLKKVKAKVAPD